MKKTLSFLLTLVMVLSISSPAVLAIGDEDPDEGIQPHYTRLATFDISLDINSKGKSVSYANATSAYGTDKIELTMELQQKVDGKWKTIKTWTNSGSFSVSLDDKAWYVESGYDYQTLATAYVYNSSGTWQETAQAVSFVASY